MDDTVWNFIGKFNGWVTPIKIRYELIQGLSAVLPYDEDIIYESQPDKISNCSGSSKNYLYNTYLLYVKLTKIENNYLHQF